MYKILIVEDCLDLQEILTLVLSPIAQLYKAASLVEARRLFQENEYDLVLMDVMLEDGDGFTLTQELRNSLYGKNVPVFFLTSKNDIYDKIKGFELGAEDYIVKPFDPLEVKLRIEARLKKIRSASNSKYVKGANLLLDLPLQKAYFVRENTEIDLTPIQFKILYCLMSSRDQVVSREKLVSDIWGNVHLGRSVDTHINSLRRKLNTYSSCIQSVYGAGYVFKTS